MILKKTWEEYTRESFTNYKDIYTGWYLFGVVPLYVSRERFRR